MAHEMLRIPLNSLNEVGIAGFLRPSEIPKVSSRTRREMDLLQVLSFFPKHFFSRYVRRASQSVCEHSCVPLLPHLAASPPRLT